MRHLLSRLPFRPLGLSRIRPYASFYNSKTPFSTSSNSNSNSKSDSDSESQSNSFKFDERTLGVIALIVSVPAAAYLWKYHHKKNGTDELKPQTSITLTKQTSSIGPKQAKYLIIGGGAASYSAIEGIKEIDPSAQIVVVTRETDLPYLRPPLSKELWFTPESEAKKTKSFVDWHGNRKPLHFQPDEYYAKNGVEFMLGTEATEIDFKARTVKLSSEGQQLKYECLLVACGADPKPIDLMAALPVNAADKVSTFRSLKDFRSLYELLSQEQDAGGEKAKRLKIAVIGGGFLGSELAVAMNSLGHEIHQIFPETGHMALVFPKYLSHWTTEKMKKLGIQIHPERSVQSVGVAKSSGNGPQQERVQLTLSDNTVLEADHVVVAVGVEPALKFLKLNTPPQEVNFHEGALKADAFLQVFPGVFAAGDCVAFKDPITGGFRRIEHFDHAIESGKIAGRNMAQWSGAQRAQESLQQQMQPYTTVSMFWSDLGPDVGYEAVGLVDSSLTTVGVWARAADDETPGYTDLDTSDIRVKELGSTSISSSESNLKLEEKGRRGEDVGLDEQGSNDMTSTPLTPDYGKGVVFYFKDRKMVGVLLFNLFNRVNLAREILKEGKSVDDVGSCVRLFNVNEKA